MPLSDAYIGGLSVNSRQNNKSIAYGVVGKTDLPDVVTADTDGYSVAHLGAAVAGTREMTLGGALAGRPDVARNVVITVTHASAVVAMSGVITGTNKAGREITEAWAVTAGTATKTYTGKKAFASVTSITETIAADASANTIIAGTGVVLGLAVKSSVPKALLEVVDAGVVTTGTLVAGVAGATTDEFGTYTPATAPNGAHDYTVWYIAEDPWNS